jgi:hypothetical protein
MINYKTFKINRLDTISPSFCAAKWLTTDIYLYNGTTSSCHLPLPDKIDISAVESDVNRIHNTVEKLAQKQQMLDGIRPDKCSNCWQVESIDSTAIAERTLYSQQFADHDLTSLNLSPSHKPAMMRVALDALCNFKCSYCDASQSTSWASDLKINGPYKNLIGDPRNTYIRLGSAQIPDYDFLFNRFVIIGTPL